MSLGWTDRLVLVTGGSSGIGRAIAIRFAELGCRVTVTAKTDDELQQFDSAGQTIARRRLDVSRETEVASCADAFDRLDFLVNCAGTIARESAEFDPREFARVVDVNLTGTMRVCAAFHDRLVASGGAVVNTASMLSFFGGGAVPAYSASKGGIAQLTKSLAIAWAPHGIRVNAVAPGWITTDLTRPLAEDASRSAEIVRRTPMGRWGRPEDVAGAVAFLCSVDAAFITGVVLPVDGGYLIQ